MAVVTETGAAGATAHPGALPDLTIVANDIGPVGGMERQLSELIVGLRRLGHRVRVVARTCELPAGTEVEFFRVRGPARPFVLALPWFMVAATFTVRRHRRGIVQANGAIVLNRVDIVAVHYCHQVGPATPSRRTRLFRAHARLADLIKRWSEPVAFRASRAAWFVCVSEGVADELASHFPWLRARLTTIHNGIDTAAFSPGARAGDAAVRRAELALPAGAPVAVFAGGEWDRKGLEFAIWALASAPDWTLLVAGAGDRAGYAELAAGLGVGDRVRWLGVCSDMPLLYQLADAFVLPTSYETFSLVTFEAAASGLPVLVTAVNGVRELVRDGENGYLITRDPDLIGERLRRLGADPQLRARLGAAARDSTLSFGSDRMVGRYHELYVRTATRARDWTRS